jgi:hypothetical protein
VYHRNEQALARESLAEHHWRNMMQRCADHNTTGNDEAKKMADFGAVPGAWLITSAGEGVTFYLGVNRRWPGKYAVEYGQGLWRPCDDTTRTDQAQQVADSGSVPSKVASKGWSTALPWQGATNQNCVGFTA